MIMHEIIKSQKKKLWGKNCKKYDVEKWQCVKSIQCGPALYAENFVMIYLVISSNSTSKINVLLGAITSPEPI